MKPPQAPPPYLVLAKRARERDRFNEVIVRSLDLGPTVEGRYRHWHTLRHLTPPEGLSHEEWWLALKLVRQGGRREIPLKDRAERPFWFTLPDEVLRLVQEVNVNLGGHVSLPRDAVSPEQRDRYVFNALAEEAITSSQLEGAVTTRMVAKEMLRSGRAPRDESEQMILGNYRVMQRVREVASDPLTPGLVRELQRIVTAGTLSDERKGVRRPGVDAHDVGVYSGTTLLHKPPPATELDGRMEAMCAFANETGNEGPFTPPVVRAIVLHFWLAYDHPFVDGNGRTARALFYWSMLRQGFWLAEYLSISRILRKGHARYGRAFLYTESDENDLTYFVLNQLAVIVRATDGLRTYVARKGREMREARALLTPDSGLNHRQIALLSHALKHPGHVYTIRSHATSHGVSPLTARKDLLALEEGGFVEKRRLRRQGRALAFTAPPDLGDRLRPA